MACAIALHRRVTLFGLRGQMLHVLGVLLFAQLIVLVVRQAAGDAFPGWWYFLPSISGCLVWPFVRRLITVPLRQRVKPEDL